MTRDQITLAINEGLPFAIKMADGHQYTVRTQLDIALGKTNVVVVDDEGLVHILPLLTMTGISYLKQPSPKKK